MVLVVVGRFVVGVAGPEAVLADEAALHQEIERAVDRGPADVPPPVPQMGVEGFRIEMAVALEDGVQDGHALARQLQLLPPEESLEPEFLLGVRFSG